MQMGCYVNQVIQSNMIAVGIATFALFWDQGTSVQLRDLGSEISLRWAIHQVAK